jgi:hypothetical protein
MARAYVETEVDVELDDFDEDDIIEHLEKLGYKVSHEDEKSDVNMLYSTWLTCSAETFEKALKEFFSEKLNIIVR